MFIGNNIKRARELKGLTQDELAKRMGYKSRSTIARIENGDNDVSQSKLKKFAEILDVSIDFLLDDGNKKMQIPHSRGIRIPILGRVVAGIPLEAITDIEGYEEITPKMASLGEYFALRIKGHSMEPRIEDGEIVIVKQQEDVECGDVAIVLVNGDEATCKQVKKSPEGITLIGFNPVVYPPHFYSNKEIEELPVRVIGRVVESRKTW
ncbi:repressor LexA [Dialister histaminiformans]|uniref:Repressor LexA n=1 Tax=Allisonella histaminiformans TaxID=209880 RepID=A0A1G5VH29_9FIRM|nr:S24 family peptidase [Allisonella histaminiformans]SDA45221.1 repressor LexA [Allisonella histaminiformans]